MEIIIAATKTCNHRPILEQQLQSSELPYKVMYFEDHPELVEQYKLKTSPILIVNGKVVSVGMPGHSKITELKEQL